jgi:hypothetical protein
LQYEHAPLDFGFRCSCIGSEVFVAELAGRAFLADFSGYKITQELARAGIGRTLLCTLIKPPRLVNSGLDLQATLCRDPMAAPSRWVRVLQSL